MADDDKALVERLAAEADNFKVAREVDMRGMLYRAADRIEALSAENERLNAIVADRLLGSSVDHRTFKDIIAENERLREALERIAANVHAPCARLMTHPDMCRQAYEARAALGETK